MTLLDNRSAELEKLQRDLHAEQQELERARQRMESELSERARKLEQLAAQLDAERQTWQQHQPTAQAVADEVPTNHPENNNPAAFNPDGPTQMTPSGGSSARKDASRLDQSPPLPGTEPQRATGDEESVEQYMARLLNRMRGGGVIIRDNDNSPPVGPAASEPPLSDKPAGTEAEAAPPVADVQTGLSVDVPQEVKVGRRAIATEAIDLSAMRELANAHSEAAISTHREYREKQHKLQNAIVSTTLVAVSVTVLFVAPGTPATVAAAAGLVLAVYFALLAGGRARRLNGPKRCIPAHLEVLLSSDTTGRSVTTGQADCQAVIENQKVEPRI